MALPWSVAKHAMNGKYIHIDIALPFKDLVNRLINCSFSWSVKYGGKMTENRIFVILFLFFILFSVICMFICNLGSILNVRV